MTDSAKLDLILSDIGGMKSDITDMKSDITDMKSDISTLQSDMVEVKSDISTLQSDVKSVKLTMENEIRHTINIIAEGHLDLSRRLEESEKVKNQREMLMIRVSVLESKVRDLEAKSA